MRLRCACHIFNTVAKRITKPYKKSKLNQQTKINCALVQTAIDCLQKIVVKLRGFTAVRQLLGTALHVPANTRWVSKLEMVTCFLNAKENIIRVVNEEKSELLLEVQNVYTKYEEIFKEYVKIIMPIKNRIKDLEVNFFSILKIKKVFRETNM